MNDEIKLMVLKRVAAGLGTATALYMSNLSANNDSLAKDVITETQRGLVADWLSYADGFDCWNPINRAILEADYDVQRGEKRSYYYALVESLVAWDTLLDDAHIIDKRRKHATLTIISPTDWEIRYLS